MGLGRKGRAIDGRNIYFLFSYFFSKHEWHLCIPYLSMNRCNVEIISYFLLYIVIF